MIHGLSRKQLQVEKSFTNLINLYSFLTFGGGQCRTVLNKGFCWLSCLNLLVLFSGYLEDH